MIVIAGTARVRPTHRDSAIDAGAMMARQSESEPGCDAYRFAIDIADDHVIHLFEQWTDEAALQHHFATAHFATFSAAITDMIDGEATFTRYDVSSAGPLFG